MKIEFAPALHKNPKDSWNGALALALKMDYDLIRKIGEPFMFPDGSTPTSFTKALLSRYDFETYKPTEPITVRKVLEVYNTFDNDVVISVPDHVVYAHNNTLYDDIAIEEANRYLEQPVEWFMMKRC